MVVAHEAPRTNGFGAEVAATVQEKCFLRLEAPIQRVTGWDTPFPLVFGESELACFLHRFCINSNISNNHLEKFYLPGVARCSDAIRTVLEY